MQRYFPLLFIVLLLAIQPIYGSPVKQAEISENYKPPSSRKIKVAFFDADGTFRISASGNLAPNDPNDVRIIPGTPSQIARLVDAGFMIAIVSNQGGIPKYFSIEQAEATFAETVQLVEQAGGEIHYWDFAEAYDDFRKPQRATLSWSYPHL